MFKPLSVEVDLLKSNPAPASEGANNIFKVLHGFYGNLFLSKYATGEVGDKGDAGVVSARSIWAHGLRKFDAATVKAALARCVQSHPEFPPSLPQFIQLCDACTVRAVFSPTQPALGMSQGLSSQYAAQARAISAKYAEARQATAKGIDAALPASLAGLKQSIARAVADAGGDEAAELLRLDRLLPVAEAA